MRAVKIREVILTPYVLEKVGRKHNVTEREIRETFANGPKVRFDERGDVRGENVYIVMGRTDSGRYLSIFFVYKRTGEALIITAREMNRKERKLYGKK